MPAGFKGDAPKWAPTVVCINSLWTACYDSVWHISSVCFTKTKVKPLEIWHATLAPFVVFALHARTSCFALGYVAGLWCLRMKYIYAENVSFINAYWPMHFVTSCSVLTLRARFDQGIAMAYGSIYLWAKIWLSKLSGLTHRLFHNFSLVWNGHVLSNASYLFVIIDSRKSAIICWSMSIELPKYLFS